MTLDKLPAPVRHFIIAVVVAPLAGVVGILAGGLVAAGGFAGFDWSTELTVALNAASVVAGSGLLGWLALYVTPLTRQYGVGSGSPDPVEGDGVAGREDFIGEEA